MADNDGAGAHTYTGSLLATEALNKKRKATSTKAAALIKKTTTDDATFKAFIKCGVSCQCNEEELATFKGVCPATKLQQCACCKKISKSKCRKSVCKTFIQEQESLLRGVAQSVSQPGLRLDASVVPETVDGYEELGNLAEELGVRVSQVTPHKGAPLPTGSPPIDAPSAMDEVLLQSMGLEQQSNKDSSSPSIDLQLPEGSSSSPSKKQRLSEDLSEDSSSPSIDLQLPEGSSSSPSKKQRLSEDLQRLSEELSYSSNINVEEPSPGVASRAQYEADKERRERIIQDREDDMRKERERENLRVRNLQKARVNEN